MKRARLLALAALMIPMVILPGCLITSGQILTHFELPNPFTINSVTSATELIPVDLNLISEYSDHKDKLKGLSDLAILGVFTNESGPAGAVEVYIAPTLDTPPATGIPGNAVLLWGPGTIGASGGSDATRVIGWDESAALFNADGKAMLISEVQGDGRFTLYTTGTSANYSIRVDDGLLVLVLDAGI